MTRFGCGCPFPLRGRCNFAYGSAQDENTQIETNFRNDSLPSPMGEGKLSSSFLGEGIGEFPSQGLVLAGPRLTAGFYFSC